MCGWRDDPVEYYDVSKDRRQVDDDVDVDEQRCVLCVAVFVSDAADVCFDACLFLGCCLGQWLCDAARAAGILMMSIRI